MRRVQRRGVEAGRPIFLVWASAPGRSEDLAARLGAHLELVHTDRLTGPATAPLRYLSYAGTTLRVVRRRRPSALIVQQPPVSLLVVAFLLARTRGLPLAIDIHHEPFEEPKWQWALRPTIWMARRSTLAVVTNETHATLLRANGVRTLVLHDPPMRTDDRPRGQGDHVLVPASFHADEPVEAILQAARLLPDRTFLVTGRVPAGFEPEVPPNVRLTGFLEWQEYLDLFVSAAAVCCLTDKPNTMQRGGYEALAWGRPLVTSDSQVLREYFGAAACYCDPHDPTSIATALRTALDGSATFSRAMSQLHATRDAGYDQDLQVLAAALAGVLLESPQVVPSPVVLSGDPPGTWEPAKDG